MASPLSLDIGYPLEGGHNHVKIKPHTRQRLLRAQIKPYVNKDQKERGSDLHKRLNKTCLGVFEGLLLECGSEVACNRDRGTVSSNPGRGSLLA